MDISMLWRNVTIKDVPAPILEMLSIVPRSSENSKVAMHVEFVNSD